MCPACKSTNVAPEPFDDGEAGKLMRKMHPNAKRCGDCRYVWWVTVPPRETNER